MTKKVVHIITALNDGGAEGVLTRLCLHSKGAQHVVISLMDAGKYGSVLQQSGVVIHCLGMSPGKPSLLRFYRLVKLLRAEQPDVVQTWMYHADLLGGIAAWLAGLRRVFWGVRHSTLEKGKSKFTTIIISRLCGLLSSSVPEKIICCANKILKVHAGIGYAAEKLMVIPNGYDLSCFKPDGIAGTEVRKKLELNPNEFVIGKVGRFDPLKDHFNLLQALALMVEQNIPFRCVLVGKGLSPDNTALVTYIVERGLQDRVVLAGQRTDIPAVMNALDLHVLSSLSEGFPNVLAEAMACGTPCASTDVGDAMEIIGDAKVCCSAQDAQALADVIIKLILEWQQAPEAWQARKDASKQRIADKFSVEGMVEAYEMCWFGPVKVVEQ
ncbi:glycosyltransferase [Pseudomonadales bacterium]|nr:glycosyltransferase [Pseudomonadales bacterium]